ncbi:hypothetical protein F4810DRAFT_450873 [Camillea tinctor]|nr:hypothetical protein F4810DRAFT_450873 [Camillea tinctor]
MANSLELCVANILRFHSCSTVPNKAGLPICHPFPPFPCDRLVFLSLFLSSLFPFLFFFLSNSFPLLPHFLPLIYCHFLFYKFVRSGFFCRGCFFTPNLAFPLTSLPPSKRYGNRTVLQMGYFTRGYGQDKRQENQHLRAIFTHEKVSIAEIIVDN